MIYRITVRVTTPVFPTEDSERVREAIQKLFPRIELTLADGELSGECHELDRFVDRIHEQAIVDTARDVFLSNRRDDSFSFSLKKQAAYEGVVNFAVGNPDELGEIAVTVIVEEPDVVTFIDEIAPRTSESGQ